MATLQYEHIEDVIKTATNELVSIERQIQASLSVPVCSHPRSASSLISRTWRTMAQDDLLATTPFTLAIVDGFLAQKDAKGGFPHLGQSRPSFASVRVLWPPSVARASEQSHAGRGSTIDA